MKDDWLDVVDERDVVLDRRRRSDVHRLGLKHRAVHVLLFNGRGELFLQKRSKAKDCFPGAWDSSASGHLDSGEEYDACAVRELREELGVDEGVTIERLFKVEACDATGQEFVWVYRGRAEGPFRLEPEEIEDGRWCEERELEVWLREREDEFASGFVEIWRRYREDRRGRSEAQEPGTAWGPCGTGDQDGAASAG